MWILFDNSAVNLNRITEIDYEPVGEVAHLIFKGCNDYMFEVTTRKLSDIEKTILFRYLASREKGLLIWRDLMREVKEVADAITEREKRIKID